jgi:hypothetical protein
MIPPTSRSTSPTAFSIAYVDEAGHPQLRMSIVGFLDILGFSHAIQTTRESADSQRLVDKIVAAIADSREYVRRDLADDFAKSSGHWALKFFSDNLVVGYPLESNDLSPAAAAQFIIRCVQRYQLRMALSGWFLRGAMTQGFICLTEDIIFGSALLECYQLETKASIVPRVILAESLRELVATSWQDSMAQMHRSAGSSICRDIDGQWFVSYLEAACDGPEVNWELVDGHKRAILESLAGTTRHDVLPKYGWACRYHNVFCHWHRDAPGYSNRLRIERLDENSTICRLGEITELMGGSA